MDEPARASLSIKLHRICICNVCPAPFMTKSNGSHMLSLLEWHILCGIRPHGFCMPPKFYTLTNQGGAVFQSGAETDHRTKHKAGCWSAAQSVKVKSAQQGPAISGVSVESQWSLSAVWCQGVSKFVKCVDQFFKTEQIEQDHLEASHLRVWASIPAGQALIFVLAIHRGWE